MKINSDVFKNNQRIPDKYTCKGENINPPLIFSDVPENSKSLVLIIEDPDAPSGLWTHWIVYNIDPGVRGIGENSFPKGGVDGITSFNNLGYGGPCPPSGTHRYFFKLYALNKVITDQERLDRETILKKMDGAIIDETQIIGLYSN